MDYLLSGELRWYHDSPHRPYTVGAIFVEIVTICKTIVNISCIAVAHGEAGRVYECFLSSANSNGKERSFIWQRKN